MKNKKSLSQEIDDQASLIIETGEKRKLTFCIEDKIINFYYYGEQFEMVGSPAEYKLLPAKAFLYTKICEFFCLYRYKIPEELCYILINDKSIWQVRMHLFKIISSIDKLHEFGDKEGKDLIKELKVQFQKKMSNEEQQICSHNENMLLMWQDVCNKDKNMLLEDIVNEVRNEI